MTATALAPPISSLATRERTWPYFALFFVSGVPALLYQIVWQRALFTIYGVNIESVTVIVTVFMLGLGLGSLAGGKLSAMPGIRALRAFGAIEFSIGVFGAGSLWIFHRVAQFTAGRSIVITGLVTFLLLLIPTLLMGSTLPLLVENLVRRRGNVGESVGALYAVNTFGSGAACFAAALFLMRSLGEAGGVRTAACLNLAVGTTALLLARLGGGKTEDEREDETPAEDRYSETIPFPMGMALAAATGFIALAFEIVWYRLYSFTSGGTASSFALLLAFYLFGIAYGAYAVHDACKGRLRNDLGRALYAGAIVVLLGTVLAYLVGPMTSFAVRYVAYGVSLALVAVAAALMGSTFPLLSHATIGPDERAGRKLGYLYLSNIVGSALGSFLIGFVVLDHWSTRDTSLLLLGLGCAVAMLLALLSRRPGVKAFFAVAVTVLVVLGAAAGPLFRGMYERLLFKDSRHDGIRLVSVVENRSGVIAVDSRETVYGGGIYDGHFNLDPIHDTNGIFRAYAMAALQPNPRQVLVIGLSSGSWTQVLVNNPGVEEMTVVEINPGYLPLIQQHAEVASLLTNPKVHIVIDDGRRWLVSHPDRKFDFILMNTTYNWRANISNLLSTDFLDIIREHLNSGGVEYYNTTESTRVQMTGVAAFPYALRVANFLALSDSPIAFDRARWRAVLQSYRIDGRPVFDLSDPAQRAVIEQMVSMPERVEMLQPNLALDHSVEREGSLRARLMGTRLITDDNMGTEWQ